MSFDVRIDSDKTAYYPGDIIKYQVWANVTGQAIDHCGAFSMTFDPNITGVSTNMTSTIDPVCNQAGNVFSCHDNSMMMWAMFSVQQEYFSLP